LLDILKALPGRGKNPGLEHFHRVIRLTAASTTNFEPSKDQHTESPSGF
jgi:hypothetical protein